MGALQNALSLRDRFKDRSRNSFSSGNTAQSAFAARTGTRFSAAPPAVAAGRRALVKKNDFGPKSALNLSGFVHCDA